MYRTLDASKYESHNIIDFFIHQLDQLPDPPSGGPRPDGAPGDPPPRPHQHQQRRHGLHAPGRGCHRHRGLDLRRHLLRGGRLAGIRAVTLFGDGEVRF